MPVGNFHFWAIVLCLVVIHLAHKTIHGISKFTKTIHGISKFTLL